MIQFVDMASEAPFDLISSALILAQLVYVRYAGTERLQTHSVGYNHGTPRTPIPKLAKKTKKKDTATIPNLYSLPPFAERPSAMAMTTQQSEHAKAEAIMTCMLIRPNLYNSDWK
jgi:hypothetical protein